MKALFSVDNEYDQPANNLVCIWKEKPSLEVLAEALGLAFPSSSDEKTLIIVNIWSGKDQRIDNTDYRLEDIKFGEMV